MGVHGSSAILERRIVQMRFQIGNSSRRPALSLRGVKRRSNLIGGTGILPVIRHPGLRSGVQSVPRLAGLVGQSRAERGIACRLMTGKMPVPPKKGLLRASALAMTLQILLAIYFFGRKSPLAPLTLPGCRKPSWSCVRCAARKRSPISQPRA
jgi:hypothetical protein